MSDNTMDADMERFFFEVRTPPFTQLDPSLALEENGYRAHTDAHGPTWSMDGRSHIDANDASLLMQPAEEDVQLYGHDDPDRPIGVNDRAEQIQSTEVHEAHRFTPDEQSLSPPFRPFARPSNVSMIGIGAWSQGYNYTVGDPVGGTEDIEWRRSCEYFQPESEPDTWQSGQLNTHPQARNTLVEGYPLSNTDVFPSGLVSDTGIVEIPGPAGGGNTYFSRRSASPWSPVRAVSFQSAAQTGDAKSELETEEAIDFY